MLSEPARSVVLRTAWRYRTRDLPPGVGKNARVEFQELLSDLRLAVWVRPGRTESCGPPPCLASRLAAALQHPDQVRRFGGLCLGESTHLINTVGPLPAEGVSGRMLMMEPKGELSLPIWPDHVGSRGTRWGRFALVPHQVSARPPDDRAWVTISRNGEA